MIMFWRKTAEKNISRIQKFAKLFPVWYSFAKIRYFREVFAISWKGLFLSTHGENLASFLHCLFLLSCIIVYFYSAAYTSVLSCIYCNTCKDAVQYSILSQNVFLFILTSGAGNYFAKYITLCGTCCSTDSFPELTAKSDPENIPSNISGLIRITIRKIWQRCKQKKMTC